MRAAASLLVLLYLTIFMHIGAVSAIGSTSSDGDFSLTDLDTVAPDLFTGSMSHRIPIAVPSGRNGLAPSLALVYSSSNGSGALGKGWALEVGAIERKIKGGVQYPGDDYIFRSAGGASELVYVGNDASGNREYRARIEGSFNRFKKMTSGYWEMTDKMGTKYLFGQSNGTRQHDPADANRIFKWCIDKVEDTYSNYMTVSYWKDQGQIYLDRIDYTGNVPTNYVKFYYESRADAASMYTLNFMVKTAYRMNTIEVFGNGNKIRAYKLSYSPGAAMIGSLLSGVQQYDKDGLAGSALPALISGYTDDMLSFASHSGPTRWVNNGSDSGPIDVSRVMTGDFNGDGKTDIAGVEGYGSSEAMSIYLSMGDGSFTGALSGPVRWVGGSVNAATIDISRIRMGDFNGDGKTDIAAVEGWGTSQAMSIYLSMGNGSFTGAFSGPTRWVNNGSDSGRIDVSRVMTGDFNGDGKTDIAGVEGYGSSEAMSIYLSLGNGSFTGALSGPVRWVGNDSNSATIDISRIRMGDFNGDGKTDIAAVEGYGSSEAMSIYLSLGNGSFTGAIPGPVRWVGNDSNSATIDVSRIRMGDFNGDGKTDIAAVEGWGTSQAMSIYLSMGDGSFTGAFSGPTRWVNNTSDGGRIDVSRVLTGDFNGDGKTDIAAVEGYGTSQAMSIYLSMSNGSFTGALQGPVRWVGEGSTSATIDISRTRIGDFGGNGKTSIAVVQGWGSSEPMAVYRFGDTPANLLNTISNGLGATTTIMYEPSTRYPNTQLPFPVQTVSSVTMSDGHGNSSKTEYDYSGGFFHIRDKEFRGFNYVKAMGQAGPDGERIVKETWFHQGDDVAVDANNLLNPIGVELPTKGYMKGKPYRVRVNDGSGNKYSETLTAYKADSTAPYFNPPEDVNTYTYDGDSTYKQTRVVNAFDDYGNVTLMSQYGDTSDSSDDSAVSKTYGYNTSAYIVGLPIKETVYKGLSATEANKQAETNYYYDGVAASDCNASSTNQVPTKGKLTRVERWLKDGTSNPSTRTAYDNYGNLSCSRDANGNKTTITYDSTYTYPKTVTNPLQHQITSQYYGVDGVAADKGLYGQLKSTTDPNNATTTYEYDTFGRNTKVIMPKPDEYSTISYNSFGTVGAQHIRTDTSGGLSSWTYFDGFGRTILEKSTGPSGKVIATQTIYNKRGAVRQKSLPYFDGESSVYTTYTYDPLGRVTYALMADGSTVDTCYNDGVSVVIDSNNHKKRQVTNALGRLVEVNEYTGTFTCSTDKGTPYSTTTYEYDTLGNLLNVKDAHNNTTTMTYDTLGRKTTMHDPDMGDWRYYYDANGNLTRQEDSSLPNNQVIHFQYDALNRLRQKDYDPIKPLDSGDIVYKYDEAHAVYGKGLITSMTDQSGSAKYYYDIMGRGEKTDKTVNGSTYTAQYGFDLLGRVNAVSYPDTTTVIGYIYDGPFLDRVYDSAVAYADYGNYNALGQPGNILYGNGVLTSYTYNNNNNSVCPKDNYLLCNIFTEKGGTVHQNLTYDYFNNGNIKSITDGTDHNQLHEADKIARLAGMTSMTYDYPTNGVRPHAVSAAGGNTYTYDNNGNMKTGAGRSITYDPDNRPMNITSGGTTSTMWYDGNGTRVKKTAGANTTLYISSLYECTNGTCTNYIFANGRRIAAKTASSTYYYHPDHLGGSSVITDNNGNEVEYIAYYPFGQTRIDSGSANVTYKYTDQELDGETALYNYNARLYDPSLGKFITADTIVQDPGDPQSFNRYAYVRNNPVNLIDPSGHSWLSDATGIDIKIGSKETTAFIYQNFAPTFVYGTYQLTQTEQGRSILMVEAAICLAAVGYFGPTDTIYYPTMAGDNGALALSKDVYYIAGFEIPAAIANPILGAGAIALTLNAFGAFDGGIDIGEYDGGSISIDTGSLGSGGSSGGGGIKQPQTIPINLGNGHIVHQPFGIDNDLMSAVMGMTSPVGAVRGLTAPSKYFGSKTLKEIEKILEKKFGLPRSIRDSAKTYYDSKMGRSFNVHQDPLHMDGRPHIDVRRRGFPERKYFLGE